MKRSTQTALALLLALVILFGPDGVEQVLVWCGG